MKKGKTKMKTEQKKIIKDEASIIRDEMKSMTTEQLKSEVSKLQISAPNDQRTLLFAMELKTRMIWEKSNISMAKFSR